MDSKYSSIGNGNSNKSVALKRKFQNSHHPDKKIKLTIKIENGKTKSQTNNHSDDSNKTLSNGCDSTNTENFIETRKILPVFAVRSRLLKEIKKNNTMILIGETGSGKTTQIPQIIHSTRLEGSGLIAVTQPRRVAAITIALRVAKEMSTEIGNIVGYCVRFEDVTSNKTKVKYLTDGMLLREAMIDPLLKNYTVVILDEAHERTVNTDVLFGIVKLAQKERLEKQLVPLKVIIMSATMDVDKFSKYYDECPVVYLEGRTHPVTVYHSKTVHEDYQYAAVCTIFQLHATTPANHDFLVFLTGQEEIESVMYNIKQIAKEMSGPQIKVCPLYAGLPPAKQLLVWKNTPPGVRKIVLATNIAEASVTIPRIKYVIDTGMVKERCPLAPTILSLVAIGVEPTTFPLIDSPPQESINGSLNILRELGAIENDGNPKLTALGKKMVSFPIDPKYSKILLSAVEHNCLDEALSLVAILSSESVFHSPMHKREEALKVKQKFISPLGDHITLLNVFKGFCKTQLKKQWCKENYLHHKNLLYACQVRQQLLAICQRFNMPVESCGKAYDQLLKCVSRGLSCQIAYLRGGVVGNRYSTASGQVASLHPSSVLHCMRPLPDLVLFTEMLHTRRAYLLTVSALQPQWLAPGHKIPELIRTTKGR